MKYGAISTATRRAGDNFPDFRVNRLQILGIRQSSLLELKKLTPALHPGN
jgi:hypothetical protein